MTPLHTANDVEYYLIKRKPKKGKPIYHARFLDSKVDAAGRRIVKFSKSTGQTNEVLAHKIVAQWIDDGKIDAVPTNLKKYLLDFWDPDKSDYLKNKFRQGKSYSSAYLEANESVIRRLFLPYFTDHGIRDLTELTAENLEEWMQHLDADENVSGRTANRARQAVWVGLNHAIKKRLIRNHPGASVEKNQENLNKREAFTLRELEAIFSAEWDDARCRAAALLAFYTGARLGEVRGLRWKNVFLSEGYVNIVENYVEVDGLKEPKWGSFRENVDIPPAVVDALLSVKAASRWKPDADQFVFFDIDSLDIPAGKQLLTASLDRVTDALNITGRTFHSLRHSFITHFGPHMRPAELRYLVGHSNEVTTERYQHRTEEGRKEIQEVQRKILPFSAVH